MASMKDLDKQISALEQRQKDLEKYLKEGEMPRRDKIGVVISPLKLPAFSQARADLLAEVESNKKQLESLYSQAGSLANKTYQSALRVGGVNASNFRNFLTEGEVNFYDKYIQYKPADAKTGPPAAVTDRKPTTVTATEEAAPAETVPTETAPVSTTATTTSTGGKGKVSAPASSVNSWVENQLELRQLPDNKANRDALRKEYKKSGSWLPADWKEKFVAKYPDLEYLLNENIFGPEVTAIVEQAMAEQWFRYPETAVALIKRKVDATPYGMTATKKQEAFDAKRPEDQMASVQERVANLQKSYGRLGLSDADWQRLGYIAERNGEDDLLTQQKLFQAIYERTPEGELRYQTAVNMVNNGKFGQEVNKEFGKYMLKASDDVVEMYTTGKTTIEEIRQQARATAKYMFPALSELIDQGVDVKTIADQYASSAADILEMPQSSINMMDPRYRLALDVREGDKSRTMGLGEWQALLRSDPNYGWQYTKAANQQAMDISTTIARAFGKIE